MDPLSKESPIECSSQTYDGENLLKATTVVRAQGGACMIRFVGEPLVLALFSSWHNVIVRFHDFL